MKKPSFFFIWNCPFTCTLYTFVGINWSIRVEIESSLKASEVYCTCNYWIGKASKAHPHSAIENFRGGKYIYFWRKKCYSLGSEYLCYLTIQVVTIFIKPKKTFLLLLRYEKTLEVYLWASCYAENHDDLSHDGELVFLNIINIFMVHFSS